jgi:hypothetical protein
MACAKGPLALGVRLGHVRFPVTRNKDQTRGREGVQRIKRNICQPHHTICCAVTNPYAHHADCDFWHDHYEHECTCSRPGMNLPAADPTQDLCAIRAEIAELKRRIERLEARLGGLAPS